MARWLVDGTNVVGSRPDGWWRDRPGAFRRLAEELGALAERGDEVTVVFDGRPDPAVGAPGVVVAWAERSGPDAADDRIVDLVGAASAPASLVVVTSDRALADRVRSRGAAVQGAGSFLRSLGAGG